MDSIHVASYMFSRVFLLLSVLCFFTFLPRVLIVLENFLSFRLFLTDQFLIQFLIVLQILQQFPTAFEFIPMYLVRIAEHVNSQW